MKCRASNPICQGVRLAFLCRRHPLVRGFFIQSRRWPFGRPLPVKDFQVD